MSMSAPGPDVASWTDANILAHLRTGDSLEVQTAQLALQQSQNPQVQSLARTLIDDHTRNMRAADSLARALRITPQPAANDTSAQHMMHEMTSWQGVTGMQFDRSWTQFQADHHRMDVQSLPKLRQQSQNPALQTFIDNTLPVIRMHVDRVQTVQQQVASGT
jgi:putative membrane protein